MVLNKTALKIVVALAASIAVVFSSVTFYIWFMLSNAKLCNIVVPEIQTKWEKGELDSFEIKYLVIFNNTLPYNVVVNYTIPVIYIYNIMLNYFKEPDTKPIVLYNILDPGEVDAARCKFETNDYRISEIMKKHIKKYGEVIPVNYTVSIKYNCSTKILGLFTLTLRRTLNYSGILMVNTSKYHPWDIEAYWYPNHVRFGEESKLHVVAYGPVNGTVEVVIVDRELNIVVEKHRYNVTLDEAEHERMVIPFKPRRPHAKYYAEVFLNSEKVWRTPIDLHCILAKL